jgi:pimeloyl-ACP methyl ester carboxylesterase
VLRPRDRRLASGDELLAATVVAAPVPSGAGVLLVHGLGSDRATNVERALALADAQGATCLAVDLAGHGRSTGRLSEVTPRQNLRDVLAAYDALLREPGVQPGRLAVAAASYGAYLSVLLTEHRPAARLLLRAPALYTDASLDQPLGRRERPEAETAADTRAVRALADYPGPVLVVESEHDEVVPAWLVRAYARARPGIEHQVLPGAQHALTEPAWRAAYTSILLAFLAEALPTPSPA